MAKTPTPVDLNVLREIINNLENDGPFPNRTALHVAVTNAYNKQLLPKKKITHSVVRDRIIKNSIEVKTPMGVRGGQWTPERKAATKIRLSEGRKNAGSRARKISKNPSKIEAISLLKEKTPRNQRGLVDDIAKGSMKSAIKLFCLACVDYDTNLVKTCTTKYCSLWVMRPYQQDPNMRMSV